MNTNVQREMEINRRALELQFPAELNAIKHILAENPQSYEPWRLTLTVDLVDAIDRNCQELLDTLSKNRLSTSAWLARNLVELWIWVKYCAVSRDNAWRFHADALRDAKGLIQSHAKGCTAMGIVDTVSAVAMPAIKKVAAERLGLQDVESDYLSVFKAAEASGVELAEKFGPFHKTLSKFAHPTAGYIHGIAHQPSQCSNLQASFTTMGVYFAQEGLFTLKEQLS